MTYFSVLKNYMYILIILYSRKCLWQASYTQSTVQVEG